MAAKSQSGDFDALGELNTKLEELLGEKEVLELEWLEAAEILGE
jgi:ATP-binding cassette subfamily F protein uup